MAGAMPLDLTRDNGKHLVFYHLRLREREQRLLRPGVLERLIRMRSYWCS